MRSGLTLLAASMVLAGCSWLPGSSLLRRGSGTPDNEPTLRTLAKREAAVEPERSIEADENLAIDAYRKFLDTSPKAPQRAEALRRIGDLEMDRAENKSAAPDASGGPDYKVAIAHYLNFLRVYPNDPGNDRVLYQLARAYEQGGDLETALKTLDRLVATYPETRYRNEADFRRGEFLFLAKRYPEAEQAYATVLASKSEHPYGDRALYMHGWSLYKQNKLEEGLGSFFGVLDLKIANKEGEGGLETIEGLTRADRELVEDTFRVASISLASMQGAESIPAFITTPERQSYEHRVYEQLAELYLRQERPKDAADAFAAFAKKNPLHIQAPVLQARVIDIYEGNGFPAKALEAKKEFVTAYGAASEFRKTNPQGWEDRAQPIVKTHLSELARYFHANAQKSKAKADYDEAVKWYRDYIASFPTDPEAANSNFLLAELLFEDKRFAEASTEYEKTAYEYPSHEKAADAGYAALLAYREQQKAVPAAQAPALDKASVASALRFADAFPTDNRTAPVLTDAAEKLYTLKQGAEAAEVAERVIAMQPPAPDAQRRVAWTVVAHTAFEASTFDKAEQAYGEVLRLTPANDTARNDLVERQAASIYKQGEQARAAGDARAAVAHFSRVAAVAPQSSIRANAQYDAAASLIVLKDWDAAARTLEDFRQRFPQHPLQKEVGGKLAAVYLEKGDWAHAAGELEQLAAVNPDPKVAREALWQAAELYEKGNAKPAATKAYERYLAQNPQPLAPAVEARWRLAKLAKEGGDARREAALMRDILEADRNGGNARTDRTRYLGATAALALAEPVAEEYRQVQLVEPLQRQLKLKKEKMESALKAYALAADYGVADVSTAATYRIANVYREFGKALVTSERPKKLSKLELEQYDVLLEEQAFPFEEKATEFHEVNARRAAIGVYDQWVKASFEALRELRPVRYGKVERVEGVVDAIR
jgi:tetratricopeptide (TPR) repeat protein